MSKKKNLIMHYPELTQIIFFDLEFFVPSEDRESERSDLRSNPFKEGHFLLGGTFYRFFPLIDKLEKHEFWLWEHDKNEKKLLTAIINLFEEGWSIVCKKPNQADLIVSGIGVSRVDIGYLYSKAIQHEIRKPDELFSIFYQLRILELENIGIPFYKNRRNFLYPKTTADLNQKFQIDTKRDSGKGVWDMFDSGDLLSIVDRNRQEVEDMFQVYSRILKELNIRSAMPKMRKESFEKLLRLVKKQDDKSFIQENYEYVEEEERFIMNTHLDFEEKYRIFRITKDSGYWKNKR